MISYFHVVRPTLLLLCCLLCRALFAQEDTVRTIVLKKKEAAPRPVLISVQGLYRSETYRPRVLHKGEMVNVNERARDYVLFMPDTNAVIIVKQTQEKKQVVCGNLFTFRPAFAVVHGYYRVAGDSVFVFASGHIPRASSQRQLPAEMKTYSEPQLVFNGTWLEGKLALRPRSLEHALRFRSCGSCTAPMETD